MRKLLLVMALAAAPLAAQNAPELFEATRTVPLTPGQWSYAATIGGSEARFGASLSIRCDRASRRVTVKRIDAGATAGALTIGTDLAVHVIGADGTLAATAPVLDAIAFSRGRFIVTGGGVRLIVPASPEAARSIEDCRI